MTVTSQPRQTEPVRRAGPAAIPGEPGLWLFLFADMTMFALLFGVVIVLRGDQPEMFAESQAHLSQGLGALNTILLLTGSLFVALAVKDARAGSGRPERHLFGAIGCGVGFLAVKAVEWGSKFSDGLTPSTNDFFSAYFMLTGIHLVHVLIGIGVLIAMLREVRKRPQGLSTPVGGEPAPRLGLLEGGGCYWHLVDLLWVVLFPLLYLMR